MKRVGNIYERIISRENCQAAVLEESRTNRLTRSGRGQELRDNLEAWTSRVQARMSTLPFVPQPTHKFSIMEGGKLRHIEMNSLFDSVCIRAMVRVVEPIIYARMSPHSYCPIKGRGPLKLARHIHKALRKMDYDNRKWMELHPKQKRYVWVLKTDVRKFFPSIGYPIAIEALRRWIKDERVIAMCGSLLKLSGGIPIGAAYSAMVANAVHLEIDWHMSSYLKVLKYWRYMDDCVMLFRAKDAAKAARDEYARLLGDRELTFARKWQIFRADRRPVTLGGFKIRAFGIHISGRISRHLNRLLGKAGKVGWDKMSHSEHLTAASLFGWIKSTDSFNYKKKWRQTHGDSVFQQIGASARARNGRPVPREHHEEGAARDPGCDLYRDAA